MTISLEKEGRRSGVCGFYWGGAKTKIQVPMGFGKMEGGRSLGGREIEVLKERGRLWVFDEFNIIYDDRG